MHLALMLPSSVSIAQLMQQMKGVSSKLANEVQSPQTPITMSRFRWQEGYSTFSISRPHAAKIVAYVQNQKQHHAAHTTWAQWEATEEYADNSSVREDGLPSE